jgi:hypothetical protein
MSNTVPAIEIPHLLLDRFANTWADFVLVLEAAAEAAPHRPGFAAQPALAALQTRALPFLHQRKQEVDAATRLAKAGTPDSVLALARSSQTLSRDLDGYDLDINRTGNFIREQLTYVILAAYRILSTTEGA